MKSDFDLQAVVEDIGPRFAEGAAERDTGDVFVAEHYDVLKRHKVFSALVPAELGGGGAGHGAMCAFLRRLAHFCPSTALALSMHQHLVAAAVHNHRNDRPGRAMLERVAAGEIVLVSTGAGDWIESNGAVERAEGGFRVSARKPFCSGAPGAACWSPRRRTRTRRRAGRCCTSRCPSRRRGSRSPTTGAPSACGPPARTPWSSTGYSCRRRRWSCGGRAAGSTRPGTSSWRRRCR